MTTRFVNFTLFLHKYKVWNSKRTWYTLAIYYYNYKMFVCHAHYNMYYLHVQIIEF